MKRHSILDRQSVKKRDSKSPSRFWGIIRLVSSLSLRVFLLLTGVISLSLLFVYLYGYLASSPYIRLEQVIVTVVDEDIRQDLIEMSGLNPDSSMLSINLNEIKEKMERHPWIKSVDLEKRFPHTLLINAEKETAAAMVLLDRLTYMDSSGRLFKYVEQEDDRDYPLITGISKAGGVREKQLKTAAAVLDLFRTETGAWSHRELSEIHISEDCDVSVYSTSLPTVIRMGRDALEAKMDELKRITRHLNEAGKMRMVRMIDLNYRDGAVVSFNDAG
jgi:cell division protein FtsQ